MKSRHFIKSKLKLRNYQEVNFKFNILKTSIHRKYRKRSLKRKDEGNVAGIPAGVVLSKTLIIKVSK